jgi:hypothetical protein
MGYIDKGCRWSFVLEAVGEIVLFVRGGPRGGLMKCWGYDRTHGHSDWFQARSLRFARGGKSVATSPKGKP